MTCNPASSSRQIRLPRNRHADSCLSPEAGSLTTLFYTGLGTGIQIAVPLSAFWGSLRLSNYARDVYTVLADVPPILVAGMLFSDPSWSSAFM